MERSIDLRTNRTPLQQAKSHERVATYSIVVIVAVIAVLAVRTISEYAGPETDRGPANGLPNVIVPVVPASSYR